MVSSLGCVLLLKVGFMCSIEDRLVLRTCRLPVVMLLFST